MRLVCPCCGASSPIEALLADRAARDTVASALALPASLGERLLRYLGLFRPRERALSWDRAARLLLELQADISAAQIERNGRVYPAPIDYWKLAIDQMLDGRDKLVLPLKSHGYLYEIIAGISQKADEKRAAKQELEEERAKARDGERSGLIALSPSPSPELEAGNTPARGESRTPPPPELLALVARWRGKSDGQTPQQPKPETQVQ
jgi:hypothetical protein